jgi:hypothetical protein
MAHFAQLDENNTVMQVIVVANDELMDNGVESEQKGILFCQSLFPETVWKQTSYNGKIRKNYAGIGMYYDADKDMFLFPKQQETNVEQEIVVVTETATATVAIEV